MDALKPQSTMSDMNGEKALIRAACAGDADAFCALYGSYQKRLYRYAFYRLGDPSDAEDAVSECILSAWRQIGSLREADAFPAWIFRILSGCCGRLIRQQAEQRSHISLDADDDSRKGRPQEDALRTEEDPALWLQIRDALSHLTDDERNIVLLSAVAGLKSGEIASLTGMTAGSVRSSLSRSLKKVRGYLSC